jgi:hypothetical protein
MAACCASVQITNIDGCVESTVSERVGHWRSNSRAIFTTVSLGPLGTWIWNILLDDEATAVASDLATCCIETPIDRSTFLAWPSVAFKDSSFARDVCFFL